MEKTILNKDNLANLAGQFSNEFKTSKNTMFDGSIVLTDSLDNLVYLSKEEVKNALECNVQVCFVSKKTVDYDENYNGKFILVPEKNANRVFAVMDSDICDYPVCISPLYEETLYKPEMIKKALENF